mmetsp:Transcript_57708/g.130766  ORF Transcript_57708/g.130766 Transcript_57708/m.130766 type:complete len:251 (-) Transcript_57708:184-936(-)
MSVAGVIVPPKGYLRRAFAAVRAQGGLCVADEVQVGFGRCGSTFWGFQQTESDGSSVAEEEEVEQEVVPDIVTMGKPFGNGMPLAAVVTTSDVANAFDNGLEYFNTFGGNPVSCAAGLAVLETLEREGLQARALAVGNLLRAGLAQLATRHLLIGDVRGMGLFLGVDLVTCRATKRAATLEASLVCTRLKDGHRVLTSLDGPADNVLVLKPPLAFDSKDAEFFLSALDEALSFVAGLGPLDPTKATRTPT